jgi:hypothetical protein
MQRIGRMLEQLLNGNGRLSVTSHQLSIQFTHSLH